MIPALEDVGRGLPCSVLYFCSAGVCVSVHRSCDQKAQGAVEVMNTTRSSKDGEEEGDVEGGRGQG